MITTDFKFKIKDSCAKPIEAMKELIVRRHYSPNEKIIIADTEMFFSHWVSVPGGQAPFFHYYIDKKQFGYINHDLKVEL